MNILSNRSEMMPKIEIDVDFVLFHRNLFSATMRPHLRLGGNDLGLGSAGHVREWAPPGWHWEVLPSESHSLVRNQGPVVDPELIWWRSCGPHVGNMPKRQ